MQLNFQQEYKSIKHLPIAELSDFTVITGANGAGKTHLLQALSQGALRIEGIEPTNTKYYNWSSLVTPDGPGINPRQLENQRNKTCQTIASVCAGYESQILQQMATFKQRYNKPFETSATKLQLLQSVNWPAPEGEYLVESTEQLTAFYTQQATKEVIVQLNSANAHRAAQFSFYPLDGRHSTVQLDLNQAFVFKQIIKNSTKPFFALMLTDCLDLYPLVSTEQDPFVGSLTGLFAGYVLTRFTNATNQTLATTFDDSSVKFLTRENFLDQYGPPPWDVFNDVLAEAKLSFRFQTPSPNAALPLRLRLKHQVSGADIQFSDLSSGERVLISLAHFLFFSEDPRQPTAMPDLILLDEVDAPLHPSMIVDLLRTVTNVMVGKYGRKVILATHSPSTVALAPEESIHVMDAETKTIRKVTRDEAVQVLTVGVPTLSINLNNRRQVFVESRNDEQFYGRIATMAQASLLPGISLTFIASGHEEGGGCDRVKSLVSQLTEAGNNSVFGVIDWDRKNTSTPNLRVLGEGIRYSIESYLLDPVLLGALLLREKLMKREQLGLLENETFVDLRDFDNARLQILVDGVLGAVGFTPISGQPLTTVHYLNGRAVQVPEKYLHEQGHALEDEHIKKAFPQLNGLFRKAADLKKTMLEKVLDDVPGLLPADFVSLFLAIQNHH